jgi:hypothetical protein
MIKRILLAVWALWHLLLAISCRPVQDDYGYLNVGSNSGFGAYLSNFWLQWGGNLSPSIIRIPFYLPSISGESWIGLGVYSFLTGALVLLTSIWLTTWLTGRSIGQYNSIDLAIGILTGFGFEGLFSPGVISAFVYGSASSTHLLPICFLLIGLGLCTIQLKNTVSKVLVAPIILIFGLVSGNSNVAEGLSGILVCLALVILFITKNSTFAKLGFLDIWRITVLFIGISIGLLAIVLSPGLRNRANLGSGLPNGIQEFALRFRSSFFSFSGEVVTHPVWILVLVIATILLKKNALLIIGERAQALILFTFFVYSSLILGATFAYAAWHQSVGLLFLLTPTGVALAGLLVKVLPAFNLKIVLEKSLISTLSLLILMLIIRVTVMEFQHAVKWDANLLTNYCLLIENDHSLLLGSEVRYPPISLGIEDVNTWPWMRDDYSKWILSPGFSKKIDC